ncbi:hypothetical protein ACQ4LE_005231 [Meloidogyne hapla]|uniref:Snake toxin/toxin-like domain-containing protein n=1 Tax=Meloidogyne hapla TaxID=6305 RepID=A0A1I8B510_MELHA
MNLFILLIILIFNRKVNCLSCYACHFAYTNSLESFRISEDGWCVNDTLLVIGKDEVIRPCAPWEKYCSTIIITIQKSFASINRQCAEECSRNCESTGYGQDQVSCTDCCEENNCNSNFSLEYYSSVMGRQFTSWTRPVKNEAKFNEKNGLKFLY